MEYIYVQVPNCARFDTWDDFKAKVYTNKTWDEALDIANGYVIFVK